MWEIYSGNKVKLFQYTNTYWIQATAILIRSEAKSKLSNKRPLSMFNEKMFINGAPRSVNTVSRLSFLKSFSFLSKRPTAFRWVILKNTYCIYKDQTSGTYER